MQELPAYITEAVNEYKPIEYDGFTLYPFKVRNYVQYMIAKRSVGFMAQRLPVELMSMPLMSALYKFECDRLINGEPATGLFSGLLVGLAFALGLAKDYEPAEEAAARFTPVVSQDDQTQLRRLLFDVNEDVTWQITPVQFSMLRPIIAAQNDIEIVDEDANPELVDAEQDIAQAKAPKLEFDIHKMIHSVAAISHTDEAEIYDWPVKKLHDRMESFKRILDYAVCGIGESQGTKWKGGNPVPNPWFDRVKESSAALISLESFAGGQATSTVLTGEANRQLSLVENTE